MRLSCNGSAHVESPLWTLLSSRRCRQKYVDEQMEKRMGVKKDDPSQARGGPMDPEQQLYITPDELKVWLMVC